MRWLVMLWLTVACQAQTWHAVSVWGRPVPVKAIRNHVALPIPSSHGSTSLVAIFTTTNTAELLGDLTGATISSTIQLRTFGNPIMWFGNNTGGPQHATIRLYFTSTSEPYNLDHGNANTTEYWWANYATVNLSNGNYFPAIPGTYTLTVPLNPALWSASHGESGADRLTEFKESVSHVAQIGFSFGGGSFFDTGIGIYNPDDHWPWPSATLYVLDYSVSRQQQAICCPQIYAY